MSGSTCRAVRPQAVGEVRVVQKLGLELPEVSDSAGRNYVALRDVAAAALIALTAGAWYARRRSLR
jgi:hypothetical protein